MSEEFENVESFKGDKSNLSFKEIVLTHLRRITQLCCVEFRGGFKLQKIHTSGKFSYTEEVYVQDTRECFINATNMLNDLLLPMFDKQMREEVDILDKDYASKKKLDKKVWNEAKIENKRKLFQQLSLLLKRLKYLESKSFGEEA